MARRLGWNMNEVRGHTMRDLAAMTGVIRQENKAADLARQRAGKRRR